MKLKIKNKTELNMLFEAFNNLKNQYTGKKRKAAFYRLFGQILVLKEQIDSKSINSNSEQKGE